MQKTRTLSLVALALSASLLMAKVLKEFPAHWGKPPDIQTMDYVELPEGYGHGSSTLKHWILANLARDRQKAAGAGGGQTAALYANDFEKIETGKVPDDFLVLGGDFTVQSDGTNKFLELPGAPLDSFSAQFGPATNANVAVSARISGAVKGRRAPTFGVGLGGVGGHKLQVAPAKKALELLKDQEIKASVPFEWKSGVWTRLRLQITESKEGNWSVAGKAWQGADEPKDWSISLTETEPPISGRASVLGSPFSGLPIAFDDVEVTVAGAAHGASAAR